MWLRPKVGSGLGSGIVDPEGLPLGGRPTPQISVPSSVGGGCMDGRPELGKSRVNSGNFVPGI